MFDSLIKVAKKALKVIVGNTGLNDDELQTAIKEEEALINSRSLSYEGTDPRDEPVLPVPAEPFLDWSVRRTVGTSSE